MHACDTYYIQRLCIYIPSMLPLQSDILLVLCSHAVLSSYLHQFCYVVFLEVECDQSILDHVFKRIKLLITTFEEGGGGGQRRKQKFEMGF